MTRTNFRKGASVWFLVMGLGSSAFSASTVTLQECFELAVQQSELLKISQETILQLAAQRRATRGLALPYVQWQWSNIRQDVSGIRPSGSGSDQTNSQKSRTTSSFNAVQPLYSGFAEFSAMSSLSSEKEREELLYKRAMDVLYADVARTYYGVILLEADLANVRDNARLTGERIDELRERVRLGKSRRSEQLSSQSQSDNLLAEETRLRGDVFRERQSLSFLTGRDMSDAILVDRINLSSVPINLMDALQRSQKRADILAFEADADAKRKAVHVARSAFHPTAEVEGNWYTQRPSGLLEDSDWDLVFRAEVPIFQGGGAFAVTAEAKSRYRAAELTLARLKRAVAWEVTTSVNLYESSVKEAQALRSAYEKARESYQIHVREYRLGLVNNLDVLQSQNIMQDIKHDLDRALLDAKLSYIDVGLSTGEKL